MTYTYVVKWRRIPEEALWVEAWPSDKDLATPDELRKPSFVVGRLRGTRTIMLWPQVRDLAKRIGFRQWGNVTHVKVPSGDIEAVAEAFRIGLAAAALTHIKGDEASDSALNYISKVTEEEIWFWASKYLGVVDEGIKTEKVVEALCILSTSS